MHNKASQCLLFCFRIYKVYTATLIETVYNKNLKTLFSSLLPSKVLLF